MNLEIGLIDSLCINKNATILEALKTIDQNKQGFLIVIDNNKYVFGTLTDGDLRRQLIIGKDLEASIQYNKKYEFLYAMDTFTEICTKFKSEHIAFLPIIDNNKKLMNILTKKVFHSLLLHDIDWDLSQDFSKINAYEVDYEIYNRPWGFYKSTLLSKYVQSKIITIFPHSELSLQEHKQREEHWVIVKGEGKVILGESEMTAYPGKYIFIPKGCKHQIINTTNKNLIFSEVQLGDYFGEDDIIRYTDKYGRV